MDEMKEGKNNFYLCFNTVNLTALLAAQFNEKMSTVLLEKFATYSCDSKKIALI